MWLIVLKLLGFILPLAQDYFSSRRRPATYAQDKQKFNSYLAGCDAHGISAMFEQLHWPKSGSDPSGQDGNKTP